MNNLKNKITYLLIIIVIVIIIIYNFFIKDDSDEFISNEFNIDDKAVNSSVLNISNDSKTEIEKIKVYIIGQVKSNGVLELNYGSRIEDAIILAGGTTEIADLSKVNLAYCLEDGQKIYIPSIYDTNINEFVTSENDESIVSSGNTGSKATNSNNKKININNASLSDLTSIPGIGESTAQKIIDYRTQNGKFSSIEDIKNVNGIGNKKYEQIKDYISLH